MRCCFCLLKRLQSGLQMRRQAQRDAPAALTVCVLFEHVLLFRATHVVCMLLRPAHLLKRLQAGLVSGIESSSALLQLCCPSLSVLPGCLLAGQLSLQIHNCTSGSELCGLGR